MKKMIITSVFAILYIIVLAQPPQLPGGFNYQAVYRDVSGNPLTNENVAVVISILQGSVDGTEVFTETHISATNDFGFLTIVIGSVNTNDFPNIDWSSGPYFLKVNINGNLMGVTQLLSVPYALYANNAGNVFSSDYADLINAPNNVSEFINDVGYIITEVDGSRTNEIQTISRIGELVTLSNDGGTYTDSVNTYTGGTGIDITNNVISATSTTPTIGFSGYGSPGQSISSNSYTMINFVLTDWNDGEGYNSSTFTVPSAGLYHFDVRVEWQSLGAINQTVSLAIYVNGISDKLVTVPAMSGPSLRFTVSNSCNMILNAGDIVSVWGKQSYATGGGLAGGSSYNHFFNGYKIY